MERRAGRFGNILSRDGKVDVNSRPLTDRPPMNWAPVTVIIFLLKLRRARLGTRPDIALALKVCGQYGATSTTCFKGRATKKYYFVAVANAISGPYETRTKSLPKLLPLSIPMKASGALSRPSTTSSRYFISPTATSGPSSC